MAIVRGLLTGATSNVEYKSFTKGNSEVARAHFRPRSRLCKWSEFLSTPHTQYAACQSELQELVRANAE
jgi:hypothetical protein